MSSEAFKVWTTLFTTDRSWIRDKGFRREAWEVFDVASRINLRAPHFAPLVLKTVALQRQTLREEFVDLWRVATTLYRALLDNRRGLTPEEAFKQPFKFGDCGLRALVGDAIRWGLDRRYLELAQGVRIEPNGKVAFYTKRWLFWRTRHELPLEETTLHLRVTANGWDALARWEETQKPHLITGGRPDWYCDYEPLSMREVAERIGKKKSTVHGSYAQTTAPDGEPLTRRWKRKTFWYWPWIHEMIEARSSSAPAA